MALKDLTGSFEGTGIECLRQYLRKAAQVGPNGPG